MVRAAICASNIELAKKMKMTIEEAKALFDEEYHSDTGLDMLFRLSADVDSDRISKFISALNCIKKHYSGKEYIERDLVYRLVSISNTLQASSGHWKVSRPEGLDPKTCFEIHQAIRNIFTD